MRLKELRKNRNLTQAELGKSLAISTSTIGMYEQGRRNPDPDMLKKIADYFNVSVDYLLKHSPTGYDKAAARLFPKKSACDIAKELERMMTNINTGNNLSFYGEPLNEKTKEIFRISLEYTLRVMTELAKENLTTQHRAQ